MGFVRDDDDDPCIAQSTLWERPSVLSLYTRNRQLLFSEMDGNIVEWCYKFIVYTHLQDGCYLRVIEDGNIVKQMRATLC